MKKRINLVRLSFLIGFLFIMFSNQAFSQNIFKNYQKQKLDRLTISSFALIDTTIQPEFLWSDKPARSQSAKILLEHWKRYQQTKRLNPVEQKKSIQLRKYFRPPQKAVGTSFISVKTTKKK